MDAANLFDQILLDGDVLARTKARDDDTKSILGSIPGPCLGIIDAEFESLEDVPDLIVGDLLAECDAYSIATKLDLARRVMPIAHVGDRGRESCIGCDLPEQAGEMAGRRQRKGRVEGLLETRRRIGPQAEPGRCADSGCDKP